MSTNLRTRRLGEAIAVAGLVLLPGMACASRGAGAARAVFHEHHTVVDGFQPCDGAFGRSDTRTVSRRELQGLVVPTLRLDAADSTAASQLMLSDSRVLAYWIELVYPRTTFYRIPAHPVSSGTRRERFLCAVRDGLLIGGFRLGISEADSSVLRPLALQGAAKRMITTVSDAAIVVAEAGVDEQSRTALTRALEDVEVSLGARAIRKPLLFLFADESRLREEFPIWSPSGMFSDWSLTSASLPGIALLSRWPNGFSSHELVHLVVASWKREAISKGDRIAFFAEEALARAIGGSRGRTFQQVVGAIDSIVARDRMRESASLRSRLDTLDFGMRQTVPPQLDELAALFRVAVRHCKSFPRELLYQSNAAHVSRIAEMLASLTRLSVDDVVSRAAAELRSREPVLFDEHNTTRVARQECGI